MAEPAAKRARMEQEPVVDEEDDTDCAHNYVRCRLVTSHDQPELNKQIDAGGKEFQLEYYHQVFGIDEKIKGYTDLSVDIWLSSQSYHSWVDVKYTHKKARADEIVGKLASADCFKAGIATSRQQFVQQLQEAAKPPSMLSGGDCVLTAQLKDGCKLQVQRYTVSEAPAHVLELHQRMEPLLLFTIDAASFIDTSDPKWELLLAVRTDAQGCEHVAGLCTLYTPFHPIKDRLRLSQVLVMPPFQGLGVGKALVKAVYQLAEQRDVLDVTAEDPSEPFLLVRERVDVERAVGCDWLMKLVKEKAAVGLKDEPEERSNDLKQDQLKDMKAGEGAGKEAHPLELPLEAALMVRRELKMHMREVRRVWETLLYMHPGCQTTYGMKLLEQLVEARLDGQLGHHQKVEQLCSSKRLLQAPGDDETWIMFRAKNTEGTEAPVKEDDNQPSEAEVAAEISKQLEARLEQVEQLADVMLAQLEQGGCGDGEEEGSEGGESGEEEGSGEGEEEEEEEEEAEGN